MTSTTNSKEASERVSDSYNKVEAAQFMAYVKCVDNLRDHGVKENSTVKAFCHQRYLQAGKHAHATKYHHHDVAIHHVCPVSGVTFHPTP